MATPAQIREGLKTNLSVITDVQVSAYMLGAPTVKHIHIFPERVDYHGAMQNGLDRKRYTVGAFVGMVSEVGAQKQLDAMLEDSGATSIKAAIEADATLGGVVSHLAVTEATGYRVYGPITERGQILGCEWTVEIID